MNLSDSELPEFSEMYRAFCLRSSRLPSVHEMDVMLRSVAAADADRYIRACGIAEVVDCPWQAPVSSNASLLVILDIDETLVDARSSPPFIHVRPGVAELFASLAALRTTHPVAVWLWTAAVDAHAARCVGALRAAFSSTGAGLPVDAVVLRRQTPSAPPPRMIGKDTRGLGPAGVADRVLLVENTPAMVVAAPLSALLLPSYVHGERVGCETLWGRLGPIPRVARVVETLAAHATLGVAECLASQKCAELGVRGATLQAGDVTFRLRLLLDVPPAVAAQLRRDAAAQVRRDTTMELPAEEPVVV